jgi:hypothetical protein
MDNKKFEQLIDLIINENEEQAKALFHDIVVEKSREIYESMMDEEGMEEGMGGQVGDLLDEIGAEEQGMTEEEEDLEFSDDGDDEVIDLDMDGEEGGEGGEEELEDRVVDLEDKLDQLMAEFEEIMGGEGEEDFSDEEGAEDFEAGEEAGEEEDQAMMEAIALKNVPGLYGSKIGGDNGVQTKSTVTSNSGQAGMDSKPVNFSGGTEANPTGPKAPSNYGSKGETQVKGAGSFKNAPAQAKQSLEKAPAPTKTQASGVNTKSPVAESRTAKKRI